LKPATKQFRIEYQRGESYEPDFVVETNSEKLIVEIKARKDLTEETVQAKSEAARTWIGHANQHARSYGGKPWRYLMVPHDEMTESTSLAGLTASFTLPEIVEQELEPAE
jgi:type III restriction enzyme